MEADETIKYLIRERKILENSIKLLSGDKLLNETEKAETAKVKGDIHKTIEAIDIAIKALSEKEN